MLTQNVNTVQQIKIKSIFTHTNIIDMLKIKKKKKTENNLIIHRISIDFLFSLLILALKFEYHV